MSKLKDNIAENGGFKHWFVNVFWYHYRWLVLVGVLVLGIIAFITFDALRRERYDTTIVVATDYYVDDEALDSLAEFCEGCTEDYDGNGRVNVQVVNLYCGDTEVGRQNQERIYLYMTQKDVALFLMSEDMAVAYTNAELEYFTDSLSNYGLPCDEDNPVRLSLAGNPVLEKCGLEDMSLAIMDHGYDTDSKNATEAAVSIANALIEAGE